MTDAFYDSRHPHERVTDAQQEAPAYDKDGRCLVCCRDEMHRLEAEREALATQLHAAQAALFAEGIRHGELEAEVARLTAELAMHWTAEPDNAEREIERLRQIERYNGTLLVERTALRALLADFVEHCTPGCCLRGCSGWASVGIEHEHWCSVGIEHEHWCPVGIEHEHWCPVPGTRRMLAQEPKGGAGEGCAR